MDPKRLWLTILIIYLVAISFSLFLPGVAIAALQLPTNLDKLMHFGEFLVLALLVMKTLEYYAQDQKLLVFFILFIAAFASELIQTQIPGRSFEWLDFLADAFGITVGTILYGLIGG